MRVRAILRIVVREQGGGQLLPEDLHQEAHLLMLALIRCRESEQLSNVRTSSDAEADLVTAEAIVDAADEKEGAERFKAVVVERLLGPSGEHRRGETKRPEYSWGEPEATCL